MKKILILFSILVFSANISFADFMPRYTQHVKPNTIGVFNPPKSFIIYSEPDENSKPLEHIQWDKNGIIANNNLNINENALFIVYLSQKETAYCLVMDEIDGWVQIYYPYTENKKGWIKTTKENRFMPWIKFYMLFGRKNGVYFFKNMPEHNKQIKSGPSDDAQRISGFHYAKFVKMSLLRGNWMLVTIVDIGNEPKVGWIKWRNEDGTLMIFPNIDK